MGKGRIVLAFALLSFGARLDAAVEESPFRATSSAPAVAVSTEDFIPLLAPVASPRPVSSRADTISHGRLRLAEVYQRDNAGSRHTISRVESGGSVERLYSGPWSLVWLGNASYRDSNVFSGSSDFRKPRLHLMTLQLSRKIDGGGFARLGRILPLELPGIGYIDGAQLQSRPREGVSVGAAAGLRPNLADLGLSARQSLASAYATVEKGARGQWYYSGTLGVLGTEFKGRADELALLYDQRSDLSPKLSIYGTAQLDYKAWNGPEPKGVRLTRANATATSPLLSFFTLRTGLDHYERPQTRAEFDFSGSTATPFTNYSYSRYWVGAEQPLIWTLQFQWLGIHAQSMPLFPAKASIYPSAILERAHSRVPGSVSRL